MVSAKELYEFLKAESIDFYTGVPDSTLKNFLNYLIQEEGYTNNHIIASNEGNAVGLATGYYISNQKPALVYMQNSGLGNAVNPITSLTEIYKVPVVYFIGWRGFPGKKDEPQHRKMGEITIELLKILGIENIVISDETKIEDIKERYKQYRDNEICKGKSIAFVFTPGSIESSSSIKYENNNTLVREDVINEIINNQEDDDIIVSTTGKTSRELFECRENNKQGHNRDFLTVGSMGHASMIALGISQNYKKRIWCLDGDGACLMHMGSMTTIGLKEPENFIHVLINNNSHESVGGMATASNNVNWKSISKSCNYKEYFYIDNMSDLRDTLKRVKSMNGPILIEIKVKIGSRENLGRPTIAPEDNIKNFINFISNKNI